MLKGIIYAVVSIVLASCGLSDEIEVRFATTKDIVVEQYSKLCSMLRAEGYSNETLAFSTRKTDQCWYPDNQYRFTVSKTGELDSGEKALSGFYVFVVFWPDKKMSTLEFSEVGKKSEFSAEAKDEVKKLSSKLESIVGGIELLND